jgi:hypothetical protein
MAVVVLEQLVVDVVIRRRAHTKPAYIPAGVTQCERAKPPVLQAKRQPSHTTWQDIQARTDPKGVQTRCE